jgi:hypothetical protein
LRRTLVTILAGLAILCVVAVIDVTLLGGDGKYRRGVARDCLTILEDRTPCSDSDSWYRVTKEKPTSDGCSRGRRRSENRELCLRPLDPIEVDIEVPPLATPSR